MKLRDTFDYIIEHDGEYQERWEHRGSTLTMIDYVAELGEQATGQYITLFEASEIVDALEEYFAMKQKIRGKLDETFCHPSPFDYCPWLSRSH